MGLNIKYKARKFLSFCLIFFLLFQSGCQSHFQNRSNLIEDDLYDPYIEMLVQNSNVVAGDTMYGRVIEASYSMDKISGEVVEEKKKFWPWIFAGLFIAGIITAAIIASGDGDGSGGNGRPSNSGTGDVIDAIFR